MKVAAICLAAAVSLGSAASFSSAAVLDAPGLTGTTYDAWDFSTLTTSNMNWAIGPDGAIEPNVTNGATGASFTKTEGDGWQLPGLIYSNGGSAYSVSVDSPVDQVRNIALQIVTGIGAGSDISDGPTLYLNGNATGSNDATPEVYSLGAISPPGGQPTTQYLWLLQWDLTSEPSTISSFHIDWSMDAHSQIYEIRLDQSDTFAPASVPEPGSLALISLGGLVLLRRKRH